MRMRRIVMLGAVATGALTLAACVPAPVTPESVAAEFATPITPAWEIDVPGIYGELVVRDGVVVAYADDEEVGLRITAHDLESGDLLWEHTASPGGAAVYSLFLSRDAAMRSYPVPTITPLVVETGSGEEARSVVVFHEREIPDESSINPHDFLRAVDVRSGEAVEITTPGVEPDDYAFEPVGITEDGGDVWADTLYPVMPCGDEPGTLCWPSEDAVAWDGAGLIRLDPATLELRYEGGYLPETGETLIPEWGFGFAQELPDEDTLVTRFVDGERAWALTDEELFGHWRSSPPDSVPFTRIGDIVLIQGYQPILETLDPEIGHTLSIDVVEARTLAAVDADSGEVLWRIPGGDMLCHAVHEREIAPDAEEIPICLAHTGGYVYDLVDEQYQEATNIDASIAGISVADGEILWEVEGAGNVSVNNVTRLIDATYSARGDLTLVDAADEEAESSIAEGLVDLTTGEWYAAPEGSTFVCRMEREDVPLEFEGSIFGGGANPFGNDYPGGWYHYPCDETAEETDTWSKGAVRVAGYHDPESPGRVVLPTLDGLVAFDL